MIRPQSAPGEILRAVRSGQIEPVASWELVKEIVEVLRRPRIQRYGVTDVDIGDIVAALEPFLPVIDVEVAIRDPNDAPVVASALAGRAEAIITGDLDFLDDPALISWLGTRGVAVFSPAVFVQRM